MAQEHREELLEMLRSGHKLQPRGEAGVGLLNQGAGSLERASLDMSLKEKGLKCLKKERM